MPARERNTILELPLKVVLTDVGQAVFRRQNKQLVRFAASEDAAEVGFPLEEFAPGALQRLLLADCVSRFDVSLSGFASRRQELMDLSKLIVYGLLYRRYDAVLLDRLRSSEVYRSRSLSVLDSRPAPDEELISAIRAEAREPLRESILRNSNLLPDEIKVQLFLSEKFLRSLRPDAWSILAAFRGGEGYDALLREVRSCLTEYMDKTRIAEYAALLIAELAEDLERKGKAVRLSWTVGGKRGAADSRGGLRVAFEAQPPEPDGNAEPGKSAGAPSRTLPEIYRAEFAGAAGPGLGPYYLAHLGEVSGKVGVAFESSVDLSGAGEPGAIDLSFQF